MSTESKVRFEQDGALGTLTLDSPPLNLIGDLYRAEEFAAWGAIDRVVAAGELHAAAETFARRLADGPSRAYSVVKDLARAYTTDGIAGAGSWRGSLSQ